MKVLVTGAGGFLGSALVKELKKQGHYVRALIRRKESAFKLRGLEVEIFICDILNKGRLRDAVEGIDVIFHTAALVKTSFPFYQRYPKELYRVNVEGTNNVFEIAYKTGVKKVIYTSSIATVGKRRDGKPADESIPLNLLHKRSHYERSKACAEKLALSYNTKGMHVVAVNPGNIAGIQDTKPTTIGEIIVKFLNGIYLFYLEGLLYITDLDTVVDAHIKAMEKGKSGERYIIINQRFFTVKEMFDILERITGIKGPRIKLPLHIAYLLSILNEAILWVLCLKNHFSPIIGSEDIKYLMLNAKYDGSKARKEFALREKPIEESLRAEVDWYMRNGYIRKSSKRRYYEELAGLRQKGI
ncbi:MAG: NAD-dependent epimerase/dehydratase family protein [Candidatus Omnitrophica bacterium]|nr:NAD-dependent epimerase/dehydratase family protein [Candidatus Omnitrophota bacterium]